STTQFQTFQEVSHPNTHLVDSSVQPGILYAYRVAAINTAGQISRYSGVVTAGIPQIDLSLNRVVSGEEMALAISAFLNDPDGSANGLQVQISNENHVNITVQNGEIRISPLPLDYTGPASFNIRAEDPSGFFDQKTIEFNFVPPGEEDTPEGNEDVPELIVYPNPVRTGRGHNELIFLNLPAETQSIGLFAVSGEKVYEDQILQPAEHRININNTADRLPSGLYIYMVKDTRAKVLEKGTITIIR
ncbi:MAG: T9SS type A sorting domain-containing protein, partial [candidate division Zixibacteria bacterium]|nr:T9SS type A sorting domain-containing protein [candidate division Zixibacteria bacterium]